ncbi:9207_t:CDS:2 [Ambispora leptoticha]|uniref:9207_t:CDS:1 n=1 Tax=Ambispora leptoticha TaxID=144679 RepID=A0A9N8YZK5_9GLOM|nr:9207_t:CDS:2 [Ambispora leptoticha]
MNFQFWKIIEDKLYKFGMGANTNVEYSDFRRLMNEWNQPYNRETDLIEFGSEKQLFTEKSKCTNLDFDVLPYPTGKLIIAALTPLILCKGIMDGEIDHSAGYGCGKRDKCFEDEKHFRKRDQKAKGISDSVYVSMKEQARVD